MEGSEHHWCDGQNSGDVWFVNKPVKNDRHPTMKLVEPVVRPVREPSQSRDMVLDPFGISAR